MERQLVTLGVGQHIKKYKMYTSPVCNKENAIVEKVTLWTPLTRFGSRKEPCSSISYTIKKTSDRLILTNSIIGLIFSNFHIQPCRFNAHKSPDIKPNLKFHVDSQVWFQKIHSTPFSSKMKCSSSKTRQTGQQVPFPNDLCIGLHQVIRNVAACQVMKDICGVLHSLLSRGGGKTQEIDQGYYW